jgi:hypothetical protein
LASRTSLKHWVCTGMKKRISTSHKSSMVWLSTWDSWGSSRSTPLRLSVTRFCSNRWGTLGRLHKMWRSRLWELIYS